LSSSKVHGNLELAECAVRDLVELNCAKGGDRVILSNMYAKVGRWDDAARTWNGDGGLRPDTGA